MECAKIEVTVPKEMQVYFSDDYAVDSGEELKRNALLLYPYIHFDMDIGKVLQDIQTFRSIKKDFFFGLSHFKDRSQRSD